MPGRTLLYVEHDGMVYLVERDGVLTFPRPEEIPFEADRKVEMRFEDTVVWYCVPRLDAWPRHWIPKDRVPALSNVDPLVQRAVNASLVREVSGALVVRAGRDGTAEVLMVKASRGFTKGMWNIPGGFVQYGESPEESVVREIEEETGLAIEVEALLGVYSERFASPYFMRGHMFLARAVTEALDLDPDEIAEARWMPAREAYEVTLNPFARQALDRLDRDRGVLRGRPWAR
ncbi:MAG TPA: NUDIX hydrolase [Candidatus Thermoplasmatota archaeon]|nr:NUDIX hydrolase [Candidatus Thermoplasmatota archaeon]